MDNSLPILVTGANRGLGFEVTKLLLYNGFSVIAIVRDMTTLASIQRENSKRLTIIKIDLSQEISNDAYSELLKLDNLSGIIHCASPFDGTIKESTPSQLADWGHFYSNALIIGKLGLDLIENGRILFIGSVVGTLGKVSKSCAPYSAYKGSLRFITEAINKETTNVEATYVNLGGFREAAVNSKDFLSTEFVAKKIIERLAEPKGIGTDYIELMSENDAKLYSNLL